MLPGFLKRIAAGEFDADGAFHRFVAKEIYPLLGQGALTTAGLVQITRAFAARANPHARWAADLEKGLGER